MERAVNAGVAIMGALLAIFVGLGWSREVLSRGTFGFDMGYLPVAIGVSWGLAASVRGISANLVARLRLFAPLASVFFFEVLADYSLSRLHAQASLHWLLAFGSFSTLMLLTAVILVVSFNYAEAFGPFCPKKRRSWRKWTLFAAVALGILVVSLPARVLMALGTITEPVASHTVYAVLVELESWFYKSSVMVYFFIIASMVFPTLEDRILGSGDIACSDRSVEKRQ